MMPLPIDFSCKTSFPCRLYTENTMIFLYVQSGQVQLIQDDNPPLILSDEDFILLSSAKNYTLECANSCEVICMHLSQSFLRQNITNSIGFYCNSAIPSSKNYSPLKKLFAKIYTLHQEDSSKNQYLIMGHLYLFIDELSHHFSYQPKTASGLTSNTRYSNSEKYQIRKEQIIQFMESNYTQPITLNDLADALFLSPEYTSVFFKKTFSMTFHQYLTQLRLHHATEIMQHNTEPLIDIAAQCGFRNFHTFYKNFYERYHETPREYRDRINVDHPNVSVKTSGQPYASTFSSDVIIEKNTITLSDYASYSARHNCELIMNIGSAKNLLSRQYQNELIMAKERFSFRYVRMQDIISNSIIPKLMPNYDYFFHDVYQILRFLYSNNFVPIIELVRSSYADQNLADTTSAAFSIQPRYIDILKALLVYCNDHFSSEWLAQWKFEIWLAPRMTIIKYTEQFKMLTNLIHTYIPNAKIGGPGYHSALSNFSLEELLSCMKQNKIAPDFISIYSNLLTAPKSSAYGTSFMIHTDAEAIISECKRIHFLVQKYFPESDFYSTTLTSVPDNRFPLAESTYQAVFLLKNLPELFSYCKCIGCFSLMGAIAPSPFENEGTSWGQGLITRDQHYTPAYYVYETLFHYNNTVTEYGDNYIVLSIDDFHYRIIAFYYSHIDYDYCSKELGTLPFYEIQNLWQDTDNIIFEYNILGLESGLYQITAMKLDSTHHSILNQLIAEYTAGNVNSNRFCSLRYSKFYKNDQKHKEQFSPEEFVYFVDLDSNEPLVLKESLSPNGLLIWDIQKKYILE